MEPRKHPIDGEIIFQTSIFGFHVNSPGWKFSFSRVWNFWDTKDSRVLAVKRCGSFEFPTWDFQTQTNQNPVVFSPHNKEIFSKVMKGAKWAMGTMTMWVLSFPAKKLLFLPMVFFPDPLKTGIIVRTQPLLHRFREGIFLQIGDFYIGWIWLVERIQHQERKKATNKQNPRNPSSCLKPLPEFFSHF